MTTILLAQSLAYTASCLSVISIIPQLVRIIKLKDATAISSSFIIIRLIAFAFYGISISIAGNPIIAMAYIPIVLLNAFLLFLKLRYTS